MTKFEVNDSVEYIGGDLTLLGLHGYVTHVGGKFVTVHFHYLTSSFVISEDDLKLVYRISQTPTTTIWGGYSWDGYEPVSVPLTNNTVSFSDVHKCEWKFYFGLNQKFEYCTICDAKRDVE